MKSYDYCLIATQKGKTIINRIYHLDRGYEDIEKKLRKVGAKIKTSKKTLNEEEYHKKIERKLNDLVIKIEKGELTLDDLSKADQKVISRMLEERK